MFTALTRCLCVSDQDGALGSGAVGSGVPQTLQQEFSLVNLQIRNVDVEVRLRRLAMIHLSQPAGRAAFAK